MLKDKLCKISLKKEMKKKDMILALNPSLSPTVSTTMARNTFLTRVFIYIFISVKNINVSRKYCSRDHNIRVISSVDEFHSADQLPRIFLKSGISAHRLRASSIIFCHIPHRTLHNYTSQISRHFNNRHWLRRGPNSATVPVTFQI